MCHSFSFLLGEQRLDDRNCPAGIGRKPSAPPGSIAWTGALPIQLHLRTHRHFQAESYSSFGMVAVSRQRHNLVSQNGLSANFSGETSVEIDDLKPGSSSING
jgi:hypothetical protein